MGAGELAVIHRVCVGDTYAREVMVSLSSISLELLSGRLLMVSHESIKALQQISIKRPELDNPVKGASNDPIQELSILKD